MKERTQAIILKTFKFGESDIICRLLTKQGAKLSLMAKGALRSKKRFGGGVLQATHVVEASYSISKKQDSDLGLFNEASLVEDFSHLRKDYDLLQASFYLLQCIDRVSQEGYELPALYNLLGNGLRALADGKSPRELRLHFQVKLLYAQGVLNPEEWQKQFLTTPLREKVPAQISSQQIYSVESLLESYLKNAEADDLKSFVPPQ